MSKVQLGDLRADGFECVSIRWRIYDGEGRAGVCTYEVKPVEVLKRIRARCPELGPHKLYRVAVFRQAHPANRKFVAQDLKLAQDQLADARDMVNAADAEIDRLECKLEESERDYRRALFNCNLLRADLADALAPMSDREKAIASRRWGKKTAFDDVIADRRRALGR